MLSDDASNSLVLPGSGTENIKQLAKQSNIKTPGEWMFRVDLQKINPCPSGNLAAPFCETEATIGNKKTYGMRWTIYGTNYLFSVGLFMINIIFKRLAPAIGLPSEMTPHFITPFKSLISHPSIDFEDNGQTVTFPAFITLVPQLITPSLAGSQTPSRGQQPVSPTSGTIAPTETHFTSTNEISSHISQSTIDAESSSAGQGFSSASPIVLDRVTPSGSDHGTSFGLEHVSPPGLDHGTSPSSDRHVTPLTPDHVTSLNPEHITPSTAYLNESITFSNSLITSDFNKITGLANEFATSSATISAIIQSISPHLVTTAQATSGHDPTVQPTTSRDATVALDIHSDSTNSTFDVPPLQIFTSTTRRTTRPPLPIKTSPRIVTVSTNGLNPTLPGDDVKKAGPPYNVGNAEEQDSLNSPSSKIKTSSYSYPKI